MSLVIPCSVCGQRTPGKLANLTWAWYLADQTRLAYRQKLCVACFAQHVAPLEVECREFALQCPSCHTSSEGDLDPVYLTVFVPGMGKLQLEMPFDAACAVHVRNFAQQGSTKLEQQASFGGQVPGPRTGTQDAPWAALGLYPRE